MKQGFSFASGNNKEDKKAIKFIQDNLQKRLKENVNITITEIECNQPDCAPIEVLIILLTEIENEKWAGKILKPLLDVTVDDILVLNLPEWIIKIDDNIPTWVVDFAIDFKEKLKTLSDKEYRSSITYLKHLFEFDDNYKKEQSIEPKDLGISKPNEETKNDIITVQMVPKEAIIERVIPPPPIRHKMNNNTFDIPIRHNKGVRPRGCPCCDPDAADVLLNFNGSI